MKKILMMIGVFMLGLAPAVGYAQINIRAPYVRINVPARQRVVVQERVVVAPVAPVTATKACPHCNARYRVETVRVPAGQPAVRVSAPFVNVNVPARPRMVVQRVLVPTCACHTGVEIAP